MSDYERFKAAFEQGTELPTPSKGNYGPRFAAVETAVQHVAGVLEAFAPKDRAKKAARAKNRSVAPAVLPEPMPTNAEVFARFCHYVTERWAIHQRRAAEQPKPWTDDPILGNRFCNNFRELDRTTIEITRIAIEPNRGNPDLWFIVLAARLHNEPDCVAELISADCLTPFDHERYRAVLEARAARDAKNYRTDAYRALIPPAGMTGPEFHALVALPAIWRMREELRPRVGDTLETFSERLRDCEGIGSFFAGQIAADMKHADAVLREATDWWTYAVPGPGSEPGLNRIRDRKPKASWPEWQWKLEVDRLAETMAPIFEAAGMPRVDRQNLQNMLCEFNKYEKLRVGEGRPKPYPGAASVPFETKTKPRKAKAATTKAPAAKPGPAPEPLPIELPATEPHCLAAALDYAARGWKLFPAPRGVKKSHRKAGADGERWGATRDPGEIAQDFARWPDANIGLPTDRDNGFWVLEADTLAGGHKHDGVAALDALIAQYGPLPETRIAESPSGSRHYYFRWPEGLVSRNRANWPVPGLDVRGDGGMVIAPPSQRETGAYRWISETEIAEAPPWLVDLVAQPKDDKPRTAAADAELLGPLCDIAAAVDVIPNNDLDWESWNKFGMAIHAASDGSEDGFAAFDRFSAKANKYDPDTTREKWQAFNGCPPDRIGFDFLAAEAHKADPEWRLKAARANTAAASAAGPEGQQQQGAPELISLQASTVGMEALEWLWPNRFALGKLGLIAGLPDEGKGLLTTAMVARVTNPDLAWPCGEGKAPQGNVILFTAEDDLADTVVPRLKAAGADLNHVHIIKLVLDTDKYGKPRRRMFSLVRDLEKLRAKIAEIGNVVLIIIDPITAYLGVGEIDSFRDADVRAVLAPLQVLAAELHAAVIAIMHFNKKVDVLNLLLRVCNSIAFTAAARHAFGVVYDADNNRRLLVRGKNNLAKRDDRALAFRVDAYEVGHDQRNGLPIEAPFLIWEADYVDITATEALQAVNENKAPGARNTAKRFLRELLRNGAVPATEIEAAAKAEGIAKRTLDRAKAELGITSVKDDDKWAWQLPHPGSGSG
jgi:putative DNA primase/helicase